jgi:type I restriction enzyme R subunit
MDEMFRRRRLPHWDVPGATYFITACLAGSIPAEGLLDIDTYREHLDRRERPTNVTESQWKGQCWKLLFARYEDWFDSKPAVRWLEDPVLAAVVAEAFYFFAGRRYDLLAYVVMPSHFHWVFTPRREYEATVPKERSARQQIMHSVKRHAALKCNKILEINGTFWQPESYDHCAEDEDELERIVDYVELNPVKAGLVKSRETWQYSSAYDRLQYGIPIGRPLVRLPSM